MAKSSVKSEDEGLFNAIGITENVEDIRKTKSRNYERYSLKFTDQYPQKGKGLPPEFVKYFLPDDGLFQKKKKKRSGWMARNKETGQSFIQWLRRGPPMPFSRVNNVYILPLYFFEDPVPKELLESLREFVEIFFQLPVKVMKKKKLKGKLSYKKNETCGTYQMDSDEILETMKSMIPTGAFCVAGITMCDLYREDSRNYLFGYARLAGQCAVISVARFLSNFGESSTTTYFSERENDTKILGRASKTMCHEIGHMFGMLHCCFYECLMNGSDDLEESDEHPIFLCPVCLRKLQMACKFDIERRYQQMIMFMASKGMTVEESWLQQRLLNLQKT